MFCKYIFVKEDRQRDFNILAMFVKQKMSRYFQIVSDNASILSLQISYIIYSLERFHFGTDRAYECMLFLNVYYVPALTSRHSKIQ